MQIEISDYDPAWPKIFERLALPIERALGSLIRSVEHVGSTAVPGLAAKPVIDIDVVVASAVDAAEAIRRLASLGYVHRGDLGIAGREAFLSPPSLHAHHLYVCIQGGVALANHLCIRDHLRADPAAARDYAALKRRLAARHADDIEAYIEGKSDFLAAILRHRDFQPDVLAAIVQANRKKPWIAEPPR